MLQFGNSYLTSSFRPATRTAELVANLSKYTNANVNTSFQSSIFSNYSSNVQATSLTQKMADFQRQMDSFNTTTTNPFATQVSYSNSQLALELENLKNLYNSLNVQTTNTVNFSTPVVTPQTVTTNSSLSDRLQVAGYDKENATKLAQASLTQAANRTKSTGWCARYVNNAIESAGLVEKDSTRTESAYQLANVYRNSSAFKEVKVSKNELKDLPAGCIIVWQRGNGFGNAFANHGHVVITQGNNKATSDYNQEIKDYGTEFSVFVPVKK